MLQRSGRKQIIRILQPEEEAKMMSLRSRCPSAPPGDSRLLREASETQELTREALGEGDVTSIIIF